MPSRPLLFYLILAGLGAASIIIAAVSWARVVTLSLPLPIYLPALNVLFTCLLGLGVLIAPRLVSRFQKQAIRFLGPYVSSVSRSALLILFVLSLVFAVPSNTQSCAADTHWLHMFVNKDDITIRRIQSQLQCCGYNSMHDRAWPFPSRDFDARTCERTQGYYIACAGLWRQEQQVAAAMSAVSSFLNWLIVMLLMHYPQPDEGNIRLPNPNVRRDSLTDEGTRGALDENTTIPRRIREQRNNDSGPETFAQTRPDDTEAGLR